MGEEGVYMEGQVGGKDDIINLISGRADEGDGGYVEGNHEYSCQKVPRRFCFERLSLSWFRKGRALLGYGSERDENSEDNVEDEKVKTGASV